MINCATPLRIVLLGAAVQACGPATAAVVDTDGGTTVASTSGPTTGPSCPIASELCPCTSGGSCDPGLACLGAVCVPASGETTASTSTDPTAATIADTSTSNASLTTATQSSDGTSSDTGGAVDLQEWTRRRPVFISNENEVALTDHQVKLDIDWDDDMAPVLADLRFTDEAGLELLPHWVESSVAPVSARLWVRVPTVPDTATIYMWYGNPLADPTEDPEAVFDHWEDFDGGDLPPGWSATDDYTVANGRLSIPSGAVISDAPIASLPGSIIEVRVRNPNVVGTTQAGFTIAQSQAAVGNQDLMQMTMPQYFLQAYDSQLGSIAAIDWGPPGPAVSEFEWSGLGMGEGALRFGRTHDDSDGSAWWLDFAGDMPNDYYVWLGSPNGTLGGSDDNEDLDVDTLLVRKFALDPPDIAVGPEEDL